MRYPVLVDFYQPLDAPQQLWLIKGLFFFFLKKSKTETRTKDIFLFSISHPFPLTCYKVKTFLCFVHLTGRQALFADFDIRSMFNRGLKKRRRLSSPRYTFRPSNSSLEERTYWKWFKRNQKHHIGHTRKSQVKKRPCLWICIQMFHS